MCKIQECDIFSEIRTFLTIDISTDESLPNKLCNECIKKISDMTKFCSTVQENEDKLRKYLKDGTLQDYYLNFTNNVPKEEKIEPIIFCDRRTYKTVMEIIRHARVHSGVKLQCSYNCGYSTAYQGALKEHENRHQSVHKYTCEKCGKGFNVKTWYEQHQNIHTGLKPFVCSICGLAFHMARYLTAHRSSMHPQSSSVKRYICVHCGQKCDSAYSLSLHLEEHGINKEKEFLCDFCGKILSSADQLKYHHRMHSGVKPYSCSICNKSFAKRYNVKVHMTSHSGEKIHSCPRCGKRYAQRSTLLQHLKRHHAGTSPDRTA
ncbi:hypothetical protein B5X24_HaOG211683 [Helicoverpa armigera]|nr:hypothetical protein B5X24_HaOG211683 [Helicoverpa armigera]